jgi:hypothetical protein
MPAPPALPKPPLFPPPEQAEVRTKDPTTRVSGPVK